MEVLLWTTKLPISLSTNGCESGTPGTVLISFKLTTGQYWICDTNGGGSYKNVDPDAEQKKVSDSDTASSGNTRALIRMMKKWQDYCSVPVKSFWIELLAIDFLSTWEHKGKSSMYYDWMVRDVLKSIVGKANT
ncbi:MAG TPA: hypothetical protein VE422_43750 [Terriglobia bacterium]|nr:hypothetical protein [Terriglobia bacterium]